MPCPHNEITIVQRSQRQSAVAAAAYQSGEKLFCEYDQQVKHYPEKRGIVHNEILLPANAPQKYAERNTLWNAAEAVEKQWNSQLARRWVLTIPREIPPDQYAVLVREFCQQQFVSKGMIADFAIHDPHPPGHNPHAHVLLTMRAMDEHGKWLPKSRKVYDLDENGERIKLPSGRWKSHKEDTVDWNDQKYCEIWRHEWEVIQNRYLEANNRPERVDLRSYARQGLDIIPTVHEGAAVRQMEKRGIQTNIGNLNREIRAANRLMKSIRQLIQNLKGWITELGEKRKELLAQKAAEEATLLPNLLMKYMEIRKEERKDWTRAGQNRGTSQDLKAVSEALSYLRQKGLSTVEDLEAFLESSEKSAADYRNQMKPKEARSKVIDGILASRTDCKECKPVYEKYQKIFFKKTKEKFKQEHPEVARYAKAAAYLAKHPDDKDSTQKELQEEQETLLEEIAALKTPLTEVQEDLKKLRDIRYWVRKATPGTEESKEPPKKQPIKEVLQDSLSVSDIVVLHQNDEDTAHYVDSIGFQQVPEFLQEQQTPVFDKLPPEQQQALSDTVQDTLQMLVDADKRIYGDVTGKTLEAIAAQGYSYKDGQLEKQQPEATPDSLLTGETVRTPRGNFHITDMSREQIEAAGFGFHHASEDGKYLIMGNGTQAYAIAAEQPQRDNPLKHVEDTIEQNDNNFDGLINNTPQTPTVADFEQRAKAGEAISVTDLAKAVKAEKREQPQKKPSILKKLDEYKKQAAQQPKDKQKEHKKDLEV